MGRIQTCDQSHDLVFYAMSNHVLVCAHSNGLLLQRCKQSERLTASCPKSDSSKAKGSDIVGPTANQKCSIHHWAERGIAGRGILLDYRSYAHIKGINYDPYDYYPISYEDLRQCGIYQGIDIRPAAQGGDIKIGDILFIRSGWKEAYDKASPGQRTKAGSRHGMDGDRFAGVSQEENILDWLHDCYFAAVCDP